MGRKYWQSVHLYPQYIKNTCKSIIKIQTTLYFLMGKIIQIVKRFELELHKDIWMPSKNVERCLILLFISKIKMKTTMRLHEHPPESLNWKMLESCCYCHPHPPPPASGCVSAVVPPLCLFILCPTLSFLTTLPPCNNFLIHLPDSSSSLSILLHSVAKLPKSFPVSPYLGVTQACQAENPWLSKISTLLASL